MKAWEAKNIIDALDPNTEVELKIVGGNGTTSGSGNTSIGLGNHPFGEGRSETQAERLGYGSR